MKHLALVVVTFLLLPLAKLAVAEEAKPVRGPNIIFILADDLGIGCVSSYGADHFKTPNIDALAKGGLRFDRCYASPLCGPSRALLMTGRYAYRTGMTGNETGALLKPAHETMMPRLLKPAGYVTAQCGKWSQLPLQPGDWGFDEYLRFEGSGKYWNTQNGAKNYILNGHQVPLKDGEYLPDRMQEFVVNFITRHRDQPFYLYYSLSHVHAQILPTPDTVPGTKDAFKIYQDNVTYMDKLVGELVAELDRLKLRENTLIVFAGDNGTALPWYRRCTIHGGKDLSGHKATMLECGSLVPCIANWPGKLPGGRVTEGLINICDFYPTLAQIAGAKLPAGVAIDGKDFTPQLYEPSAQWPRDWIFVELGRHWYDRDAAWKLNESRELFDMHGAPFSEPLVPADSTDPAAIAARSHLQAVLNELDPAKGMVDPGNGSGMTQRRRKKSEPASTLGNPGNQNKDDE